MGNDILVLVMTTCVATVLLQYLQVDRQHTHTHRFRQSSQTWLLGHADFMQEGKVRLASYMLLLLPSACCHYCSGEATALACFQQVTR